MALACHLWLREPPTKVNILISNIKKKKKKWERKNINVPKLERMSLFIYLFLSWVVLI
jgi:hypothetical protein